ncbi:3265_t:CDS:2 [Funneliformis geosporum]|uniref:9860_t:CDS:1 n=1 Tax=Funneliformis geosporum TaxID=1117311 RepID=A0A9W4WVZ7_9GLOM|nr:3265_t:CDS:2 [Funneliformis geosporum]CAI2190843.1 9860_t:CDS:2 [Funneliformis geosporum]
MVNSTKRTVKKSEKVLVKSAVQVDEIDNKVDINNELATESQQVFPESHQNKTTTARSMATPRSRGGRGKRPTNTPVRSSPRIVRRSASYPNAVNRHFVNGIPILEITLRFDEDEYDVWRRQDTDEVNLHYLLRIKYPRDEDEQAWQAELDRLKREVNEIKVIEEGWFEGVWVPLEKAKDIAHRYNIYEHVAALLESENSWFDTPKKQSAKIKSERAMNQMNSMVALNSVSSQSEVPVETTNGTTPTTRSIATNNYVMANGTVRSDNEIKSRRRTSERIKAKSQPGQESPSSSTKRLREIENERDIKDVKEEVQNLKRKSDEIEEYLIYNENGNNNKRRAVWAGIGAAVGAGITAVALNSMGFGVPEIVDGISKIFNS